jgi:hypothetical protein
VPGGRLGDLEQIVEHHPVPALQERLGLAKKNGRWLVFRLVEHEAAMRFNALLAPNPVRSAEPQMPAQAPGPVAQPVVPAK